MGATTTGRDLAPRVASRVDDGGRALIVFRWRFEVLVAAAGVLGVVGIMQFEG